MAAGWWHEACLFKMKAGGGVMSKMMAGGGVMAKTKMMKIAGGMSLMVMNRAGGKGDINPSKMPSAQDDHARA
jgi:hypothetical protein